MKGSVDRVLIRKSVVLLNNVGIRTDYAYAHARSHVVIDILNTEIGKSVLNGIIIGHYYYYYNHWVTVNIVKSTIFENGYAGCEMYTYKGWTKMFVSNSIFLKNRHGALNLINYYQTQTVKHIFHNNIFLGNRDSVIHISDYGTNLTEWLFTHNLFSNNSGKCNIISNYCITL